MVPKYNEDLQNRVAVYVVELFNKTQPPELIFHNLVHTQTVVNRCKELIEYYPLSDTEKFIVFTAAWFHDCGHLSGPVFQHEERSIAIMSNYLTSIEVEEIIIQSIEECIVATKLPYQPTFLLAEILCDADSFHLGTDEFFFSDELVKKEYELRNGFVPEEWDKTTLALLRNHQFFTFYCREKLNKGKQINIDFLQAKVDQDNNS